MILALLQPAALLGLLLGFLLSVYVRLVAQRFFGARLVDHRPPGPRAWRFDWRHDIDVFGAVGAGLGGLGWGKQSHLSHEGVSFSSHGYGRATTLQSHRRAVSLAIASGPIAVLVVSQLAFLVYRITYGDTFSLFAGYRASEMLLGVEGAGGFGPSFLLSVAVSMLCFAVLAFVPLPPLDGWGLLWLALKRPGEGMQKARHWLVDQNLGAVILVVLSLPLGSSGAILPRILDIITTPLMRLWA
jgi:hypothetical protein